MPPTPKPPAAGPASPLDEARWRAVLGRDAAADGQFVLAVKKGDVEKAIAVMRTHIGRTAKHVSKDKRRKEIDDPRRDRLRGLLGHGDIPVLVDRQALL